MRVIFLTITFYPEPSAIHGLPLAKHLASKGYDIKVLTSFPQYPIGKIYPGYRLRPWQRETVEGIPVLRVPIYPSHDDSAIKRIITYLSFAFFASTIGTALIGSADVIYLYDPPPTNGLASLILKAFRGIPIVHDIADMWPETVIESGMVRGKYAKKIMGSIIGAWCKLLYRQAEVVTVLSPGFKQLLVDRGVPADKVRVIYNWTDEKLFYPVDPDRNLARQLGLEGYFNIVYAGNLGVHQGLDTVIKAAALIKDKKNIQVVIIGIGPKEEELKELASELGVTNVLFLGRRPYEEMTKINGLADVLLVHLKDRPFLRTTIPGKTQVSLASGRPILMAVKGDASEVVRRAEAGVICEPDNPTELAKAMVQMASMPKSELETMGIKGREYYLKHLSLDVAFGSLDEVFQKVVSTRKVKKV
jgi:colanic acid biosynthesis glycosyl transferase WcaI